MRPFRRTDAVILGLVLTALCSAGCRSVTAPEAQPKVPDGRLGAPARTFAVEPSTAAGSALSPSGLEIRWDDVGGDRVTVGIAELWSPQRQSEYVSGALSLRAVADDYARRFGAPDARFVSEGIAGGIDLLHYDSGSLRSTLAGAADPAVRDGRFFVAVNLNPGTDGRPVPVASDRADPASGHGRLFTVAVIAGQPWATPIDRVAIVIQGAAYRPAVFSARAGRPMVVSLSNRDAEAHDFIVPGLPSPVHLFMTAHKDIVSSLTFPTPGEYEFYCSLRAHRSAGMEGRVVVDG